MSLEPKPTHANVGLGGGASNRSAMVLEVLHDGGEVELVACGGKGQVERLPLSSTGRRAGSPASARPVRAHSMAQNQRPTLGSRRCLVVNHCFGVASGQVVMDLCVILFHTFQCCE